MQQRNSPRGVCFSSPEESTLGIKTPYKSPEGALFYSPERQLWVDKGEENRAL